MEEKRERERGGGGKGGEKIPRGGEDREGSVLGLQCKILKEES